MSGMRSRWLVALAWSFGSIGGKGAAGAGCAAAERVSSATTGHR